MKTRKAKDLGLGDIIRTLGPDGNPNILGYSTATVKQISKDGYITLFRPYVHTDNFSYTGGVICYIGIETYQIPANDTLVELCEESKPLM